MNILEKIAEKTKQRIEEEKKVISYSEIMNILDKNTYDKIYKHSFLEYFSDNDLNIISEIKLSSPSSGQISNLKPLDVAKMYLENGAKALSVLTEPYFFNGDINYIAQIKTDFKKSKILMKDFIIDEYQIYKAKAFGADAVLLIVALLSLEELKKYLESCNKLNLTALVEVHDLEEMKIAIDSGACLIGVNNRNLKDLSISLKTSEELACFKTSDITLISESGLKTHDDLIYLKSIGYDGFLIGTHFMKSNNPAQSLLEILKG